MLVSAPATAALDALFASFAPAFSGEHPKTSATAAFKNVLDDLTPLEHSDPGGNAKQQSATVPEPASKKQQAHSPGSLTGIAAAPQTAGIKLPQAHLASSEAGRNTLSGENTARDAEPSQSPAGDSTPAQPLDNQPVTIAMLPQTVPLEPEETPVHATVPAPHLTIPAGAPNAKLVARTVFAGRALTAVSSRAALEPATVRPASQPHALPESAPAEQAAMTADAAENERIPAAPVAAAASQQTPAKPSISNPTLLVEGPARQPMTGKPSATPPIPQEKSDITHQEIHQNKPDAIVTTQSAKNSPPTAHSVPAALGELAPANTTPAANPSARPTTRPGATAILPAPANHEVLAANVNPIGRSTLSSEQTIASSQQPAAKPSASGSAPETPPAPQLPARASGFTALSTTPEVLTAPVPVAPNPEQTPQAQTAIPAATSSAAAPDLEQPAEAQAPAMPFSPATPMPATAPSHVAISGPAADPTTQPAGPLTAQRETPGATPEEKSPLQPQAGNFAFAVRLLGLDDGSNHGSVTQSGASSDNGELSLTQPLTEPLTQPKQPAPEPQNSPAQQTATPEGQNANQQSANQTPHESQPAAAPPTGKPESATQSQPEIPAAPKPVQPSHPGDAPAFQVSQQAPQIESPSGLDRGEVAEPHVSLAAQETRLGGPEVPRSSASSEILLHLTGDDQSPAAIRVAERAGSVSVAVHAADPVLRESLRTNLGDLSAQLNMQGWKTETTKSAAVAAHSDNPQDSHAGGQRGSGQQGSGGDRQPQRDRRGNGGQWREALNQQITGNQANPGGNR